MLPSFESASKFARGFVRSPAGVGSIIPSSRYMEDKLVEIGELTTKSTIVELGPGTGGTTRALLKSMPDDCTLICMEIDQDFVELVREISDPRLIVHNSSAEKIIESLLTEQRESADLVVSGIPFSTMPRDLGVTILKNIQNVLTPGGIFIAYQLRGTVAELSKPIFGSPTETCFVWRNVPPMRIYSWNKQSSIRAHTSNIRN